MEPTPSRRDPALLVILGVIVLVVVASLIAVFTKGAPTQLDPTTPEGVVQRYTTALIESDLETAREFVDDDALADCATSYPSESGRDVRITLDSSRVGDTTAVVNVTIHTTYDPGPFGGSGYSSSESFRLSSSGGDWRITQAPWRFDVCTVEGVR